MSTVRDIKSLIAEVHIAIDEEGCTGVFEDGFYRRIQDIGDMLQREGARPPDEAGLNDEAEKLFSELKRWLATQHHAFADLSSAA